jgi:hypothetical protein
MRRIEIEMKELNEEIYLKNAAKFVKKLTKSRLKKADEYGCRVYAFVDAQVDELDVYFELHIGNPHEQVCFRDIESQLSQKDYIWASSGSFLEAWQEVKSSAFQMRESIFNYCESSLADGLRQAIYIHNEMR